MTAPPGGRYGQEMGRASIVAALVGVLGTLVGMLRLRTSGGSPYLYWTLGLVALLPAWLIAFLGVLGPSIIGRPESGVPFISSSSAALVGTIVSDALVRRLRDSARPHGPVTYWLLGLGALGPAWGIALLWLSRLRP